MSSDGNGSGKSFWTTLPGVLAGLAALITALVGLYVALYPRTEPKSPETPSTTSPNANAGKTQGPNDTGNPPIFPPDPNAGKIQVPNVIGMSWLDAQAKIRGSDLKAKYELQPNGIPDGRIINQNPQPGTFIEPGTSVSLILVGAYGSDTCLQGYVWRDAFSGDHVCVTPETRAQAASDNSQASARRNPSGGTYGPDTCLQGYVWRDAFSGDHVCVTPETRAQAASDNSQASARRIIP
jgi:hypothetical protein